MADYDISAVPRRKVYTGSAGVGPYAFTFEVLTQTDIAVYQNDTLLTLTTDYTVTIDANGTGSVTLLVAAVGADRIVITGARAIERTTDFTTGGDLTAASLNEQLDANVIHSQQVAESLRRALKAPVYDPEDVESGGALDMTLPAAATRANKVLSFDANGNPTTAVAIATEAYADAAAAAIAVGSGNVPSPTGGQTNYVLKATGAAAWDWSDTVSGLTLTSPTINGAALSGTLSGTPTFSGTATFSAAATFSSTINKVTLTAPATSATITPTDGTSTTLSGGLVREALIANRTYYVRTDGSNSNTGLANTAGGAFLTLQGAFDSIASRIDMKGYTVTIQIADGTYDAADTYLPIMTGQDEAAGLIIQGNVGTPANVILNTSIAFRGVVLANTGTGCWLKGFTIGGALASSYGIQSGGGTILFETINFGNSGAGSAHILAQDNGIVRATGAYTITAAAAYHLHAIGGGIIKVQSVANTGGTFAFTTFALSDANGMIFSNGCTWSGSITGTRYSSTLNSVIQTFGGGASYFPGNVAGSTATGGQYA